MNEIVNRYLATWNAEDGDRRTLLDEHWARDCVYVDPLGEAQGRDAVGAMISAVRSQFPEQVFTQVGSLDAHHRQVRFQWGLGRPDAEPVIIGFDVLVVDEDDRIVDVRGFLDKVPA